MRLFRGLRQFGLLRTLVWELRKFRAEQQATRKALERVADALELRNVHDFPVLVQPNPDAPGVEVLYTSDAEQHDLMEIEMRLTAATGQPPTEEQILEEFERLRTKVEDQQQTHADIEARRLR